MNEKLFEVVEKPISVQEMIKKVERREAGAITTFIGTVREFTKGKRTIYLEYQAYIPMAEKKCSQKLGRKLEGTGLIQK